jgi:hypothetical protein
MAAGRVEREDEGIAQRAADGARLDLRALWRRASAAPLFPIGIELAACRVFHENRLPALARLRRIRPQMMWPDERSQRLGVSNSA